MDPEGSEPSGPTFKGSDWMSDMAKEQDNSPKRAKRDEILTETNNAATNLQVQIGAKQFKGDSFECDEDNRVSLKYEKKDDNRYRVNILLIDESKRISRIKMAQILKSLNVQNVTDIKSISKLKLCVYFNNHETANKFAEQDLTQFNLKTEIPNHYVSVVGVLRDVPLDMNMQSLFEMIDENEKVLKVERIYRKARKEVDLDTTFRRRQSDEKNFNFEPTYSVKVTFKAPVLPKEISMTFFKEKVHVFIGVTRQCQNCLRFGHTRFQCKSRIRCEYCGENHSSNKCTFVRL
jgi:hypothetical protein